MYAYAMLTDIVVVVVYRLNSSRHSNSVLLWTPIQPVVNLFIQATLVQRKEIEKKKNSF